MSKNKIIKRTNSIPLNAKVLTVALLVLIIAGTIAHENFLSFRNLLSVILQMSEAGLMALGLTIVIITGGIDLSIGSIAGLCATVSGVLMASGMRALPAVAISFFVAIACGLLNALLIAIIKVPAMVATLGTQMFFYGIAMGLSKGNSVSQLDKDIFFIGQGAVLGIPVQAIVLILCTFLISVMLKKYYLGRSIIAIGNNSKASQYAGIKVEKTLFKTYVLCAILCFAAGIIQVGRVATSRADMGSTYLMECLAAVVLGGTSITGGKGTAIGSVVGILIFTLISNVMNLAGISAFWQQFTTGLVLILVVVFNSITETRQRAKRSQLLEMEDMDL